MTEPSSGVPSEIADAEVTAPQEERPSADVHLDQDKVEAWEEVKSDYEVEPDGQPVPNSMDATPFEPAEDEPADDEADS